MNSPLDPTTRDYLLGLKRRGVVLGLERMARFAAALGNPQERFPVVHIAGTNGKGSVAAMLESILRAAGWRVGLYTSPHLVRLGERVQVNRQPLSASKVAAYVAELRSVVEQLVAAEGEAARPSYFEFMTGLAFVHFRQSACDVAVVEVGVGGRLDATNIVSPELSVITSIGLDHCDILGDTIEKIAAEKAGIIKPGRPVVIGHLPEDAAGVIRRVAARHAAPICSIVSTFGTDTADYPRTNLAGDYQRLNAATAVVAARQLGEKWRITPERITRGLLDVEWPARWQPFNVGGRRVIVDTTHNAEGAAMLERSLAELEKETSHRPVVIVGALGAARARPLLEAICRHAVEVQLVEPRQPRATPYEELERLIPADFHGAVVRTRVDEVFPNRSSCLPGRALEEPVVVTGSIYLAGEVLARIDPSRGPFEPDLQDF